MLDCINKINIEKTLKVSAVFIFVMHLLTAMPQLLRELSQPTGFSIGLFFSVIITLLFSIAGSLFQALVLLALAELIKIKKENKNA